MRAKRRVSAARKLRSARLRAPRATRPMLWSLVGMLGPRGFVRRRLLGRCYGVLSECSVRSASCAANTLVDSKEFLSEIAARAVPRSRSMAVFLMVCLPVLPRPSPTGKAPISVGAFFRGRFSPGVRISRPPCRESPGGRRWRRRSWSWAPAGRMRVRHAS